MYYYGLHIVEKRRLVGFHVTWRKRQEEIKTREIGTQESKNREVEDVNITKKSSSNLLKTRHISHALLSPPHLPFAFSQTKTMWPKFYVIVIYHMQLKSLMHY